VERLRVTTAAAVGVETLAARLESEVCGGGGVVVWPPLVGAWACKPG
jgi:hypothetical protein